MPGAVVNGSGTAQAQLAGAASGNAEDQPTAGQRHSVISVLPASVSVEQDVAAPPGRSRGAVRSQGRVLAGDYFHPPFQGEVLRPDVNRRAERKVLQADLQPVHI